MSLSTNSSIANYTIISKLGAGGMGEVYLAEDTKLDRKAAIKFLDEEFARDPDKLKRFIQGISTIANTTRRLRREAVPMNSIQLFRSLAIGLAWHWSRTESTTKRLLSAGRSRPTRPLDGCRLSQSHMRMPNRANV